MSDLNRLQGILKKLLRENVSSGDFTKSNFKSKLEFFFEFVTDQYSSLGEYPRSTVLELIKKTVANATPSGLSPNGRIPVPNSNRVWVSVYYAYHMLDKSFVSKESIATWLKDTWPDLSVKEDVLEYSWDVLKHATEPRTRKRPRDEQDKSGPRKRVKVCVKKLAIAE